MGRKGILSAKRMEGEHKRRSVLTFHLEQSSGRSKVPFRLTRMSIADQGGQQGALRARVERRRGDPLLGQKVRLRTVSGKFPMQPRNDVRTACTQVLPLRCKPMVKVRAPVEVDAFKEIASAQA